ncbi:MAG: crotonase/enoyl-CoA hydratase family protein [Novosphingobium sp.]
MTIPFTNDDRVTIELDDRGVAQLRLARPAKMNALDIAMFESLVAAGDALSRSRGVRAVVLAGEGGCFCAGFDLANFESWQGAGAPDLPARTHGDANMFQQAAIQWRHLPMPVIAAVHGACLGGGLQLASGADIRIVAPDAKLSILELKWGLVPDMAGFALWRGLVRDDVLRELLFSHRIFSGEDALDLGFATLVDRDPLARATAMAHAIAERNPDAVRAAKALANRALDATAAELLLAESRAQAQLMWSPNQVEAVASQMERRAARYVDP